MEPPKSPKRTISTSHISCFSQAGVNPGIGPIRLTEIHEPGKHPRTRFQSERDLTVAHEKETDRRERFVDRDQRRQRAAINPNHSIAVSIKDSLLEVQHVYLEHLAAEENHVTEIARSSSLHTIDFEKNRREAERVVERLWSSERSLNFHFDTAYDAGTTGISSGIEQE